MSGLQSIALMLAAIGPLIVLARMLRVPQSILLIATGLAAAFLPGLPPGRVDPQLMLSLFLPPIVYAATVRVSYHLLRFALLPGVLVGVALTAATIPGVALAARWLLPGLDWVPALLLGTIAALFDTRLFQEAEGRLQVPRAIADALRAREMVARLLALGVFALLLSTLPDGPPSRLAAAGRLGWSLGAGAVAGWALGWAVLKLRDRVETTPVEIAVSLALPYLASLAAGWLGASVPAAVMAAALTVSAIRIDRKTGAPRSSSDTRLAAAAFWEEAGLLLSAVLFLLAGRALPEALSGLETWPLWQICGAAAGLLALLLALHLAFSYLAAALPGPTAALRAHNEGDGTGLTRLMAAGVMAWASTPSVIGLVAALSVPAGVEDRGLLLLVAAFLVLGATALQGFSLGPAVRAAALGNEDEDRREKALAEHVAITAAAREEDEGKSHDAARRALLSLRERDEIGDEMLRRMLREADLRSRAAEGGANTRPAPKGA